MPTLISGEVLKNAIRGKGLTMEQAAQKLKMSRQNLYFQLNKASVTEEFYKKAVDELGLKDLAEKATAEQNHIAYKRAINFISDLFGDSVSKVVGNIILSTISPRGYPGIGGSSIGIEKYHQVVDYLSENYVSDQFPRRKNLQTKLVNSLFIGLDINNIKKELQQTERARGYKLLISDESAKVSENGKKYIKETKEIIGELQLRLNKKVSEYLNIVPGATVETTELDLLSLIGLFIDCYDDEMFALESFVFAVPSDHKAQMYKDDYIDLLKKQNELLTEQLAIFRNLVETNLKTIQGNVETLHNHDIAYHRTMLSSLARLEKRKDVGSLNEEADILEASMLGLIENKDNPVSSGSKNKVS